MGKDTERKLTGKVIAVNPGDDLAAVRVEGDKLPEPIPVVSSEKLFESQPLTVFGFPRGTELAEGLQRGLGVRDLKTTLKARPTTVAGRVVNTDQSVRASKGPKRPVVPEREHAELVAALGCVDLVVLFDDADALALLSALRPDLHVKGTDYTEQTVPERENVLAYGGAVRITGDPKDHSTRDIISRILKRD